MSPSSDLLGRVLRRVHADPSRSPLERNGLQAPHALLLSSPEFTDGGPIPASSAGRGVGENISPTLQWTAVPAATATLVLLLDDIDAPLRKPLFHNGAVLEPDVEGLQRGAFRAGTAGLRMIPTLLSKEAYAGPRPIPGHGPHRYRFHLLALDRAVPDNVATVKSLLAVADGHVLARGSLTGTYQR